MPEPTRPEREARRSAILPSAGAQSSAILSTAEAQRFLKPGGDRLDSLERVLLSLGLAPSVAKTGGAKNLVLRVGQGSPRLILVAHYDRAPGSPGALDNSCACLQLASFAARLATARDRPLGEQGRAERGEPPSLLFAFTDAEEAPGQGEAASQGAYALSRALSSAIAQARAEGGRPPGALVLDVTGRGDRLILSTAPAELLARNGLSRSPAAEGHRELAQLAMRAALGAGLSEPAEASLPWSDDLGLTLGGIPALALSLLPKGELAMLRSGKKPPTWELLHTAADTPDRIEASAFDLMARFLDALAERMTG